MPSVMVPPTAAALNVGFVLAVIAVFVGIGLAVDRLGPTRSGDEPEPR